MRDSAFDFWLERHHEVRAGGPMARRARQSRISNCRHVEAYEGDLDAHWAKDECAGLLSRLTYGRDEEDRGVPPRHRIPIDGDRYTGTATLRSAITLYAKFCRAWPKGAAGLRR